MVWLEFIQTFPEWSFINKAMFLLWAIASIGGGIYFVVIANNIKKMHVAGQNPAAVQGNTFQSSSSGDNYSFGSVKGNVAVGGKTSLVTQENIQVKLRLLQVRQGKGDEWDALIVDVVNTGDINVFLEKAELFHESKLVGEDSLKRVRTTKTDNPNITQYHEFYPELRPGEKEEEVVRGFYDPNNYKKPVDMQQCRGKLTVKVWTTRGNVFSKDMEYLGIQK
jgi:hypothetical protein